MPQRFRAILSLTSVGLVAILLLDLQRAMSEGVADSPVAPPSEPEDDPVEPPVAFEAARSPAPEPVLAVAPISVAEPPVAEAVQARPGLTVDEEKLAWLRTQRTKLESLITTHDLDDRRIWSLVKQLVGPTYSCTLERQGRGLPVDEASRVHADGTRGVSSEGHDCLYLGFGKAYYLEYAEFPCMRDLLDTASAMSGIEIENETLLLDTDALASRLALFCARIDAEL